MRLQGFKTIPPSRISTETAANTLLTKTVRTKEKIRKKTRGLWDTARQLRGLSDLLTSPEKEQDGIPGQHGPLIELNPEPADDLPELKTETEDAGSPDRSQKKPGTDTARPSSRRYVKTANKITKKARKSQKDKINPNIKHHGNEAPVNLYPDNEEADSPENPPEALPDISVREIFDELEEIERLIRERLAG